MGKANLKKAALDTLYGLHDLFQPKAYGNARFMRKHEMGELLNPKENSGLFFNPSYSLSQEESCTGSMLIAGTGAGKTTRFHIPNILRCQGSMIVTDAYMTESRSIFNQTSGCKQAQGFKIKVLDFDRPKQSHRFSHLVYNQSADQSQEAADRQSETMAGKDPIWHGGAGTFLHILQSALLRSGDRDLTHAYNIGWLIRNFGMAGEGIEDFILRTIHPANPHGSADLWASWLDFIKKDSKLLQGVLFTASMAMRKWQDRKSNLSVITGGDDMELDKLREEKTIIYLRMRKTQLPRYSFFLNLFITTCMQVLAETANENQRLPLYLFLDEFGNLPKIENFDSLATTLRESGVSVNITAQSIAQLVKTYGAEGASIIMGNLNFRMYSGGLPLETREVISKTLGNETIQEVVHPQTTDEKARTITTGKPLMSPQELKEMPKGKWVVDYAEKKPILFENVKPFYECPVLRKATEMSPAKMNFPPFRFPKRAPLAITETWRELPQKNLDKSLEQKTSATFQSSISKVLDKANSRLDSRRKPVSLDRSSS